MTLLLRLRDIRREYPSGEGAFAALNDITFDVHAGEYVAIIGPSGSGKSTLLNILGCLDRSTSGIFTVAGRSTALMSADARAALRRELFGFIFQRYNLLPDLTALGNVEIPAIYSGDDRKLRQSRAASILKRLKLEDRLDYRPAQLSGGQQQRVSIARALINGGGIILADEPTGALDSRAGEEVLAIFQELHRQGHTIIIVTHDAKIAQHAERIIELRDGKIVSDRRTLTLKRSQFQECPGIMAFLPTCQYSSSRRELASGLAESLHMAFLSTRTHRLRTFLDIYPGTGSGDLRAARVHTLRATDALQVVSLPFIDSATPGVSASAALRYGAMAASAEVYGVGEQFFRVKGMKLLKGALFDTQAVNRMDPSVVLDENASNQIFGNSVNPIGQIILLGKVPCRVSGVVARSSIAFGVSSLSVWAPYTSVLTRLLGQSYVSSITVRVSDRTPTKMAEEAITKVLTLQHGRKDFFIQDTAQIRETIEATTKTMTWLISSIAAISLLVGGIGVMNITLVSVTERTREIGVRIAVGARQNDILQQFLIEAVLVCLIGGALGVALAFGIGALAAYLGNENFPMIFSSGSIVAAFVCATLIGIIFGFLPARNAARLDPIEALARE